MTTSEQIKICRVVAHQAKHLIAKGADGSASSPFVKMSCDKERFMTSVAEKSSSPLWNEDCEFNAREDSCLEFQVYHRGKVLDDFLGRVSIPVADLPSSEPHSATTRWYKLQSRPGKTRKDGKDRGEIEITLEVLEDTISTHQAAGFDLDGSEVRGQGSSNKAKRSSSLRAKTPGLKSKLKVPRLKSYTAVNKDENTSPESSFVGREKSDSNDSGRASDSLASESPASVKRLSHNALGQVGSLESVSSCGSHSKEKKGGLKKRMKSAIGSLKRDKTHSKEFLAQSPYSSVTSLPQDELSESQPDSSMDGPVDAPHQPWPSDPRPSSSDPLSGAVTLRHRTASASDLDTTAPKTSRPLSYPLRAISEEYIPLDAFTPRSGSPWSQGTTPHQQSAFESEEDCEERALARENKLRHSFRSGLPSLRKSNVSVTFDPSKENGYGTHCKEVEAKLPAQYVKMTKEELISRVLLKERLLRDRQQYIRELEDYTDNLLLKVMLESPRLLDRDFRPRVAKPTR